MQTSLHSLVAVRFIVLLINVKSERRSEQANARSSLLSLYVHISLLTGYLNTASDPCVTAVYSARLFDYLVYLLWKSSV